MNWLRLDQRLPSWPWIRLAKKVAWKQSTTCRNAAENWVKWRRSRSGSWLILSFKQQTFQPHPILSLIGGVTPQLPILRLTIVTAWALRLNTNACEGVLKVVTMVNLYKIIIISLILSFFTRVRLYRSIVTAGLALAKRQAATWNLTNQWSLSIILIRLAALLLLWTSNN